MAQLITLATCNLNQWALDLKGNTNRIKIAIEQAVSKGASLLVTPELSLTGYGCLDHFLELDLIIQCWECVQSLLESTPDGIIVDVGLPLLHRGCIFNTRLIFFNKKILLLRPKQSLANDGNFREMRYFTAWARPRETDPFILPEAIQAITSQVEVPFGDSYIQSKDCSIAAESCEELFTPQSPHIALGFEGVDIITNSSGSHHSLRKLHVRMDLILEATRKSPAVYIYSNQIGADGDRLYYDGCAMIVVNGQIRAIAPQFSLDEVCVVAATIDLQEVRSARFPPSSRVQSQKAPHYPSPIRLDTRLGHPADVFDPTVKPSPDIDPEYLKPEEEIKLGPGHFLWDYLRRSNQAGYFLALSGGIDSGATAVLVYYMCQFVHDAIQQGNLQVLKDARRIVGEPDSSQWTPSSPSALCNRILHTSFMGTSNSSAATRSRAKDLAKEIGAYHIDCNLDSIVSAITSLFTSIFGITLRFRSAGGSSVENLALQNIQARLRMVFQYLFAQTLPFVRGRTAPGSLLVLSSANLDESLRGYLTKYDCSSADICVIGSISKNDLKRFISFAKDDLQTPLLEDFITAPPTAELEPITADYTQSDEADMGVTYNELSIFGRLRKLQRMGPFAMWSHLLHVWGDDLSPRRIYEKVRHFFWYYSINRHKMTTLTPTLHCENYSCDDNRYDLRPFLYPTNLYAYEMIEKRLAIMEKVKAKQA